MTVGIEYTSALAGLESVGPIRLEALLAAGEPEDVWERLVARPCGIRPSPQLNMELLTKLANEARSVDPLSSWERLQALGIQAARPGDEDYPAPLDRLVAPPPIIYCAGRARPEDQVNVAVVGTRRCTRYGHDIARHLGSALSAAGVGVVSGLALGIDAAAHRGVMTHRAGDAAPPIGVVASGIDVVYPRRNVDLWRQVIDRGLLLSEVPIGVRPARWRFVARNRLIAALSSAVVVVESHEQGGALTTVDWAIEIDIPVYAVPGSITSPSSRGTNRLISDVGRPIVDLDEFVADVTGSMLATGLPTERTPPAVALTLHAEAVLSLIGDAAVSFDEIVERSRLDLTLVAEALDRLQSDRLIEARSGWFERVGR